MTDELLIDLVRQWPCLYNPRDKDYMDSNKRTKIWEQIAFKCNMDVKKLRTRWYNIKENYRKSLAKRKTFSNDPTKKVKNYKFEHILEFLNPFMAEDLVSFAATNNVPIEDEYYENNVWEIKEEPPEEYTLEAETVMPSSPVNSPPRSEHSSPVVHNFGKRSAVKKAARSSAADRLMEFVLANQQATAAVKSADELFFQSLAMRIRDWPEVKKTKLQISILQCVQEVEKEL